jgi:heme/copper-type cytochrome/quinol oxidase subunit 2
MNTRLWLRSVCGLLLLLAVTGLGACASGGMGAGGAGNTVLRVENNLIPATSLSIYAVPEVGTRTLVGVVDPSSTATLRFNASAAGGQYRFVAETTAGNEIASNPITVSSGATIRWDLTANIATVVDSG